MFYFSVCFALNLLMILSHTLFISTLDNQLMLVFEYLFKHIDVKSFHCSKYSLSWCVSCIRAYYFLKRVEKKRVLNANHFFNILLDFKGSASISSIMSIMLGAQS